jgi:hypothetical protein
MLRLSGNESYENGNALSQNNGRRLGKLKFIYTEAYSIYQRASPRHSLITEQNPRRGEDGQRGGSAIVKSERVREKRGWCVLVQVREGKGKKKNKNGSMDGWTGRWCYVWVVLSTYNCPCRPGTTMAQKSQVVGKVPYGGCWRMAGPPFSLVAALTRNERRQ